MTNKYLEKIAEWEKEAFAASVGKKLKSSMTNARAVSKPNEIAKGSFFTNKQKADFGKASKSTSSNKSFFTDKQMSDFNKAKSS